MFKAEVSSGTRAHFTLIDMNGTSSGRVDGGIGLMLAEPRIRVTAHPSGMPEVHWGEHAAPSSRGELTEAAFTALTAVNREFGVEPAALEITECPDAHLGLGTKTQLKMAVASAAAACAGVDIDATALGDALGRGGTSAIGTHGFRHGGFILDGGHPLTSKREGGAYRPSSASTGSGVAPLLMRHPFPDWPIAVVTPNGRRIHGETERKLFLEVCPVPLEDVRSLSHEILMRLIPAIVTADIDAFGSSLWAVQDHTWKSFETASQAPAVGEVVERMRDELAIGGLCMSSWGPSLICVDRRLLTPDAAVLLERIRGLLEETAGGGSVVMTRALNAGADIRRHERQHSEQS